MRVSDEDWALAVEAIRGSLYDKLSSSQKNAILLSTWAVQDGFPDSPASEWDWSGYRDSSQQAKQRIIDTVKTLLKRWKIHVDLDKIKSLADESRKLREMLRAEMPEAFEDGETS